MRILVFILSSSAIRCSTRSRTFGTGFPDSSMGPGVPGRKNSRRIEASIATIARATNFAQLPIRVFAPLSANGP